MYQTNLRIRYSDAFHTGKMNIHSILELFQDVGYFHSEDLGYGEKKIRESGNAWYLLSWHLAIQTLPEANEYVTVTTEPYKMKGFFAYRRYHILNDKGEVMVMGDALWLYMNHIEMIPQRITKEIHDTYIPEPLEYKPIVQRKLKDQGEWQYLKDTIVQDYLIDTNQHLNNTNYLILIDEYLPVDVEGQSVNIEYRQAAKKGDKLSIYQCLEENKIRFLLKNSKEEISCIIECIQKKEEEKSNV